MSKRNFMDLLRARWEAGFMLCVGLDSNLTQLPWAHIHTPTGHGTQGDLIFWFNRRIIEATADVVCAYKLQVAFYEAMGPGGIVAMMRTVEFIKSDFPHIPIIVDAKRGDIGNTSAAYAKTIFDEWGFDATTVNGYMGEEALRPLLDREGKGIIVLCRTSNPGASEFQDRRVSFGNDMDPVSRIVGHAVIDAPLYQYVAFRVARRWQSKADRLLVVGATVPEELAEVRRIAPDTGLLVPGIGKQGDDIEKTVRAGLDEDGGGMIINSSRGIIFASDGEDFAEAAELEAARTHNEIALFRNKALAERQFA